MSVQHVKRVFRSNFRNIRFGQPYWLAASGTGSAPLIKFNRTASLAGQNADGSPILSTQSPTNAAVIKVNPRLSHVANWHG